jgi:AcrR family transcriptional regulator
MTRRSKPPGKPASTASAAPVAKPRGRPGGRSARVRSAVLQAAFELLMEKGVDALTIAAVAERSGVHETTIYRQWGTIHALSRDACIQYAEVQFPIPDTGSLRSDLAAILKRLAATMASPQGKAVLTLSLSPHPHVVAARQDLWRRRFHLMRPVFDRAVARGEFPPRADPVEFLEGLIAPLYMRALITGEPVEAWPRNEMIDRMLVAYSGKKRPRS